MRIIFKNLITTKQIPFIISNLFICFLTTLFQMWLKSIFENTFMNVFFCFPGHVDETRKTMFIANISSWCKKVPGAKLMCLHVSCDKLVDMWTQLREALSRMINTPGGYWFCGELLAVFPQPQTVIFPAHARWSWKDFKTHKKSRIKWFNGVSQASLVSEHNCGPSEK